MVYNLKDIRIIFVSFIVALFWFSGGHSVFSQVDQESLSEISDEDLELIEEYLDQAQTLFEQRFTESTIFYYDKVLAINPLNIDALNGMAFVLDFVGSSEDAISYYDEVLLIDPKNNDALLGKALALDNLGKSEEAIFFLDKALETEDTPQPIQDITDEDLGFLQVSFELAQELFEGGHYEEAISYYDLVLQTIPSDIDALIGKAIALGVIGNHEESILFYDKVLLIDPKNNEAQLGKSLTLESIVTEEEPLLEISDGDLDLLEEFLEQAEEFFDEENYEEAILLYSLVLGIDPTDFDALFGMADSLENLGNYEETIIYYDLILAIDSSDIDALFGKALALQNLEDYENAISHYDLILAIDSSDLDALNGKALALESLGREDEAITLLEEAIELIPPELEETINQDDVAGSDQILFAIIGVFIVILISIILIDFVARRRKNVINFETSVSEQQSVLSKSSNNSTYYQKIDDISTDQKDVTSNLEVNQAIKILQNLADMKLLDDPKTAKQFLLNKEFSENAVKNAIQSMRIDSTQVDE